MAKRKNYYYVSVFTNEGPKYVTKVDYATKMSHWNTEDKPLVMSKELAEDMMRGLTWNGHMCAVVVSLWELDTHPYNYSDYTCTFNKKEGK